MCQSITNLLYWNSELIIIVKLLEIQLQKEKFLTEFSTCILFIPSYGKIYRKVIDTSLEQKNLTLTRKRFINTR